MFIVESTFTGKSGRNRHSWITCVAFSRERAEEQSTRLAEQAVDQRIFEIDAKSFPVYFAGSSLDFRFVSRDQLRSDLLKYPTGDPEAILFNIYRFSGEYLWSVPGLDHACNHHHVTSETLVQFREAEGELHTWLCGSE